MQSEVGKRQEGVRARVIVWEKKKERKMSILLFHEVSWWV